MTLNEVIKNIFPASFKLLPEKFWSTEALVMLLAIGLQESRFEFRRQLGNGPARGFWQFEEGNDKSRAGVWGTMHHRTSGPYVRQLCKHFDIPFDSKAIWQALETNDVLACCMARLLLLTDSYKLPAVTDTEVAWKLYAERVWRPGKPHRQTWDAFHKQAQLSVVG